MKDVNDLARILHEAFQIATTGRPGPVVVDIPKDVQFKKGAYIGPDQVQHRTYRPKTDPDAAAIARAVEMMAAAKRPDLLYRRRHHQCRARKPAKLLRELVDADRLSRHLDPDGAGRLSGIRRRNGWACWACTAPTKPTMPCMIAT